MDPDAFIDDLCRRFRVSPDFGRRLLPLVKRANECEPGLSARLLAMVERSFEEESRRTLDGRPHGLDESDWKSLTTVARVLHDWDPPLWLRLSGPMQIPLDELENDEF